MFTLYKYKMLSCSKKFFFVIFSTIMFMTDEYGLANVTYSTTESRLGNSELLL